MKTIDELKALQEKTLTTDEYAEARNSVKKLINELESIDFKTGEDYLIFKFGTLKAWNMTSERGVDLLKEYFNDGVSSSVMMQKDSEQQRKVLCQLIDECNGSIQSDWSGECFTKEEAKAYVADC